MKAPHAPPRRRFLQAGTALLALPRAVAAPGDALRILCSGPAGSIPDLVARAVAEQWPRAGARPLVDNRPGAAGQISVAALKHAPAEGNTLLLAQGAIATVYPHLYTRLGYDPVADLQPVALASEMLLALAVGPAVPAEVTTLPAFMTWLRDHPAQAALGSPGTGTLPHLLEALLMAPQGMTWEHVPYAGGPPALTDLVGGRIAALVLPEGLLRQHHAAGRVRVLATSGAQRSAYLPGVPSFAEAGRPDLVVKEWFAFFAPGRAPKAGVEEQAAQLREALARPELAAAFATAGMTPAWMGPPALAARIAQEREYWRPVLLTHGIRADP